LRTILKKRRLLGRIKNYKKIYKFLVNNYINCNDVVFPSKTK
jgi:hypothetical protein